jgi:hypothetical protein
MLLVFDMISCGDLGVRQEWIKGLGWAVLLILSIELDLGWSKARELLEGSRGAEVV